MTNHRQRDEMVTLQSLCVKLLSDVTWQYCEHSLREDYLRHAEKLLSWAQGWARMGHSSPMHCLSANVLGQVAVAARQLSVKNDKHARHAELLTVLSSAVVRVLDETMLLYQDVEQIQVHACSVLGHLLLPRSTLQQNKEDQRQRLFITDGDGDQAKAHAVTIAGADHTLAATGEAKGLLLALQRHCASNVVISQLAPIKQVLRERVIAHTATTTGHSS